MVSICDMLREMLQGKLHHATVTDCRLDYPGSLTVDIDLIERSGLLVHQRIQLLNCRDVVSSRASVVVVIEIL